MKNRLRRAAILVAGLLVGQAVLYGASLGGWKVLLALDLLAQPHIYLPPSVTGPVAPQSAVLSDPVYSEEPARHFAIGELRAGRLPLWDPYEYAGCPFGWPWLSPFQLIDLALGLPRALAWAQLAQSIFAGLGAYFFCRRALGVGFWPATVAAWCYPLTGFFIFWQGFMPDRAVAFLPWILLAVEETIRAPARRSWGGPALAFFSGMSVICGQIDVAGEVLLASGLFAVCRLVAQLVETRSLKRTGTSAVVLAAAWALGLALTTPMILPRVEYSRTGSRMQRRSKGEEERPPVGLVALPQTVLPDIYGTSNKGSLWMGPPTESNQLESSATTYAGLLASLFVVPLAWCSRRHLALNITWIILGVIGLAWVLNVPGIVQLMRLPPLNMLSYNRFVFVASFALLAMTATGLEVLFNEEIRPRWWFGLPLAILLAIAGWCLYQAVALPEPVANQLGAAIKSGRTVGSVQNLADVREVQGWFIRTYLAGTLLAGLGAAGWLLLFFRAWNRRWLSPLLAGLLVADLLWFGYGRNPQCNPAWYYPKIPVLEQIAASQPGRIIGYACLPAVLANTVPLRDIRGYDAVDPARFIDLMGPVADRKTPPIPYALTQWLIPSYAMDSPSSIRLHPILDMFGVRYVVFRGLPPAGLTPDFRGDDYWAVVNQRALPRVFVPQRVETAAEWNQLKKKMESKFFLFQRAAGLLHELAANMEQFAAAIKDADPRKAGVLQNIALIKETAAFLEIAKTRGAKEEFDPREAALFRAVTDLVRQVADNIAAQDPRKAGEYREAAEILGVANTIDAKDDFNPHEVAYVESDKPLDLPQPCQGSAEIDEEIPSRIKVSAEMQTRGLVVLSDLWDSGWNAYLDGRPVPILKTNHAIRGVEVPAGKSTIEFRYEPASLAWSLRISGLALLASIGWLGVSLRKPLPAAPVAPVAPVTPPVESVPPPSQPTPPRLPSKPGNRRSKRRAN